MHLLLKRALLLLPCLFVISDARSEISNVQLLGASNVQALVGFSVPLDADCKVAVSESDTLTPLVNDVNPDLFAGSDSSARAGNITGVWRIAVIGKRSVERGQDRKWYSRALQADTQHYYRIRCGAETASGTFRTANIPVGITYPWAIPQDPATGDFRWPSIDNGHRTQAVIDPNYGTLIRRVTIPGDVPGLSFPGQKFAKATGANWSNPEASLADDKSAATYSGSGQDWLVLTDPAIGLTDTYRDAQSIDWITVSVKGTGPVEACLTLDGASCHGQIRGAVLEGTAKAVALGAGTPIDTWSDNLWSNDIDARRNKLFGVMLRAKSGASGVSIQYASLSLQMSEVAGMPTAGSFRTCSPVKSNGGFHCSYPGAGGASVNWIYWIHPESGEVRYLGRVIAENWGGPAALCSAYNALWDASDPNVYYCVAYQDGKQALLKGTYVGNDVSAAPGNYINMRWENLTPGRNTVDALIEQFNPEFNPAEYGCALSVLTNQYGVFRCLRGGQNTVGWMAALDLGANPPRVVAAAKTFASPASRWCGIHSLEPIEGTNWIGWTPTRLGDDNGGPFKVLLAAPARAAAGRMTLQVSGRPVPLLMEVAVGDYFQFPGNSDFVRIVEKKSDTEWVVDRIVAKGTAAVAQPAATPLAAYCGAFIGAPATPTVYWSFLDDPAAQDTTGKSVAIEKLVSGGHIVQRGDYRLQEWWHDGYQVVTPGVPRGLNSPVTFTIPSNPKWAGHRVWLGLSEPAAGLEGYQTHPSYENYQAPGEGRNNWFVDLIPFVGSAKIHDGVTAVAGQSRVYKVNGVHLNRNLFPTFALCGGRQLKDISPGPITDQSVNSYCVGAGCAANAAAAGVFVSCPAPVNAGSRCRENYYGDDSAVCVSDLAPYGQSVTQFFLDPSGARNRVLTNGLLAWHAPQTFMVLDTASPLPDGSWIVFPSFANNTRRDLYMVKVPPQPPFDKDPAAHAQPVNALVTVNSPDNASIRKMRIEFGYTPDLGSKSAAQPCAAASACTLHVPARSLSVLYTKPIYLDSAGKQIAEGALSVQLTE